MNGDRRQKRITSFSFLKLLAIALFLCGNTAVMANVSDVVAADITQQSQSMSGLVVDAQGEPIIGASVLEKGTTNGTITDINGRFNLSVNEGATLVISYIGYKQQEVRATPNLRVILVEDSEILDEVVVVGYGSQKRANLTGAVATVDVDKALSGRPIADVGRGLQGTTPGLSITIPSGEVGSDPTIKIRGQLGSIEGGSEPLILLDNVEIPSIQLVNPDDIESISVLKDAASQSIYGAKAAFGVILITTKKGAKQESVNVSYSGNFSWQNISKKMDMGMVDAIGYSVNAMERVNATVAGAFWMVDRSSWEAAQQWQQQYGGKIGANDPFVYGRDWYVNAEGRKFSMRTFDPYDYMIREWAPSTAHNISVSGRSGKTDYNVGLGYLDQNGMMKPAKHDDFRRYNASVRLSTEISKYITVRAGAIFSKRDKRYAYATSSTTADPWLYLYRWGPTMPMGFDDQGRELRSPVSELNQANTANLENNYTNINLGATINITKDWTVDVDYTHANEETINNRPGTRYTALDTWSSALQKPDGTYELKYHEYTASGSNPDHIYRKSINATRNTWNAYTTYNWRLNEANVFKFMAGINRVTWTEKNNWSQKTKLLDISNPQFDLASGTETSGGGTAWEGQLGYFGRINYSLYDKYLLEANLRYDGTSKFPSDLQWRWFPSFSAGWRISEEAFMQPLKPVLSSLKLRGSWGMIGDQTVPNTLYVPIMKSGQSTWIGGDGSKLAYVGTPDAIISTITWQDITTLDIGLDARFFDNKLGVSFDWYQRDTKNLIIPASNVTLNFGADSPKSNFGNLRTRGWEIAVDFNHRFNNGLGINLMATLSDAITEITDYGDVKGIDGNYAGKKYGEIWGFRTDRLYQKDDFVYNGNDPVYVWVNGKNVYDVETPGAKKMQKLKDPNGVYQDYLQASSNFIFGPGDVKYKDLNGDGVVNDGARQVDDHGDLEVIGNSTPRYEYGFRIGADYKGFDFSMFFQGVGKRDLWGYGFLAIPGFNSADGAMPQAIASNYWTEERTNAFYPRPYNLGAPAVNTFRSGANNMNVQSRYLLDMSYLRIKNITLGYTLPTDIAKKAFMQKARVYVTLENFFTFDNLNDLPIDPEEVPGYNMFRKDSGYTDGYNGDRVGVGAPTFKSVSVGVQLNF